MNGIQSNDQDFTPPNSSNAQILPLIDNSYQQSPSNSIPAFTQFQDQHDRDASLSPFEGSDINTDTDEWEHEKGNRARYPGSDSLWRYHNRNELALYKSILDKRGDDLAAHLYNIHVWKTKYNGGKKVKDAQRGNGSEGEESNTEERDAESGKKKEKEWVPDRSWTAWPLEVEICPTVHERLWSRRENEQSNDGLLDKDNNVFQDLRDELFAMGKRIVKKRWEIRVGAEKGNQVVKESSIRNVIKINEESDNDVQDSDDDVDENGNENAEENEDEGVDDASTDIDIDDSDEENPTMDVMEDNVETGDQNPDNSCALPRPILSADEDISNSYLRPIVNNTTSTLDKLLMALHHNHAGHHAVARDEYSISLRRRSHSRSRSSSKAFRSSSKRRYNSGTDSENAGAKSIKKRKRRSSSDDDECNGRSRSRQKRRPSRSSLGSCGRSEESNSDSDSELEDRQHHLQDWTRIIGIAEIIGIDANIIDKCRIRCSNLFGKPKEEHVNTNHDTGHGESRVINDGRSQVTNDGRESQVINAPVINDGYRCPEPTCSRFIKPFKKSHGYRFKEHMRRVHLFDGPRLDYILTMVGMYTSRGRTTDRNPRMWTPPDTMQCPEVDCNSHDKIWQEPRRLLDHIIRKHGYDPRRESRPRITMTGENV